MTYDMALWTCPTCRHRVESERVVDDTFIPRMEEHKRLHEVDAAAILMMRELGIPAGEVAEMLSDALRRRG